MDEVMKASAEMDGIVPELWSAAFYPTLLERMPFNSSVARDYEGEIQALGDTVNINSIPQFDVASEMNEGDANAADSTTFAKSQLIVNKQVAKDYIITKKALRQSIDAQNALRDLALHAIMKKMQQIIIAEIAPSASAPDHTLAYTSGTMLALADILTAKELLDNSDVEEIGRTMILGAAQMNDLFNITGFTSRDFIPENGSPLASGAIATPVLGFIPKWTTAAGNTAHFFHPLFLQMAVQQLPEVEVVSLGAEGKRATRVNMDVLFGVKQMSNLRVVTIS